MLLEMKRLDDVSSELGDDVAKRGARNSACPALHHLRGVNILIRIVGLGQRSRGPGSQDAGVVEDRSSPIRAPDHGTCSGIYGSIEELVAAAKLVIPGILVEEGGEDGIAEDFLGRTCGGGCTQALCKGIAIDAIVRCAIDQMGPPRGGCPGEHAEGGHRLSQSHRHLIANMLLRSLSSGRNKFDSWKKNGRIACGGALVE